MVFEILQPITKPRSACSGSETLHRNIFLASEDALEVMRVTDWLSNWVSVGIDFTDVTLVSDDTYKRYYWCDPDDPDENYLVMKLSSDESYLVMKVM